MESPIDQRLRQAVNASALSPEAEELAGAIVNAPFARSELPFSSAALGEVTVRMSEVAPYSATQATLKKGELYTVVGESMTCSIGLRSKRLIVLHDLNGEGFARLLCFSPEDFDALNFAENQVVCVALYVVTLDVTPVFLPVLVIGPSAKGDHLNLIRPHYDDSLLELVKPTYWVELAAGG
ncbi:MAG: hypothetical protein JNJ70_24245 [Verrucomicrobiales bacterium]|nr:hypothetical protein [Verrucomicrobiales bacterium]